MNKVKLLSVVATLFASQTSFANTLPLTIDFENADAGGFLGGSIYTESIRGEALTPKGDSSAFYAVAPNKTAMLDLAANTYNNISFLWGSVDSYNHVQLTLSDKSVVTIDGSSYKLNNGTTDTIFSFNSNSLFVNKVSLVNGNMPAFEIDNFTASATATAVPEPETYSMMLGGLGLIGYAARRKANKS
jgi:hypothetical protein